jgi:hypothetical protein
MNMEARGYVHGLPLDLLPSGVESLIYRSIARLHRNSLLQVSRWGRDAVLRKARSISLDLLTSDVEAGHNLGPLPDSWHVPVRQQNQGSLCALISAWYNMRRAASTAMSWLTC